MKFETLKTGKFATKKQIIIGSTAVVVVLVATLSFIHSFAKYRVTQSYKLAEGTVNYKVADFKVMAMYQQKEGSTCTTVGSCYDEITGRMPGSGYEINTTNSYCTLNGSKDTSAVLKTVDGNHVIANLMKGEKCYLYFDKGASTASETLIAKSKKGSGTPTFSKTSCTSGCEEATVGTYTVSDPVYGGTSTYWRGDTTDNYVSFANKCWRIVRINGDGSIRLIYDGATCHANGTSTADSIAVASQAYNSSYNQSNYVGWTYTGTSQRTTGGTASNAKSQIESWYSANITGTNTNKVADGKYCNDRNVDAAPSSWGSGYVTTWSATGTQFAYAGAKRLYESYQPTLSCSSGDIYTLKVGLITADEVEFAGGKNANNQKYYLYNGQNYWTMSPSYWNSSGNANVFYVISDGYLNANSVHFTYGLRPVINLKSDTKFSSGSGTQSSPYVVS